MKNADEPDVDLPECLPDAAHEVWFLSDDNLPFMGNVTRRQSRFVWQAARREVESQLYELRDRLDKAEGALLRKGYAKNCDIPVCNCGDQWNHGGFAEIRLDEISRALDGRDYGKTILAAVEELVALSEAARNYATRTLTPDTELKGRGA